MVARSNIAQCQEEQFAKKRYYKDSCRADIAVCLQLQKARLLNVHSFKVYCNKYHAQCTKQNTINNWLHCRRSNCTVMNNFKLYCTSNFCKIIYCKHLNCTLLHVFKIIYIQYISKGYVLHCTVSKSRQGNLVNNKPSTN